MRLGHTKSVCITAVYALVVMLCETHRAQGKSLKSDKGRVVYHSVIYPYTQIFIVLHRCILVLYRNEPPLNPECL